MLLLLFEFVFFFCFFLDALFDDGFEEPFLFEELFLLDDEDEEELLFFDDSFEFEAIVTEAFNGTHLPFDELACTCDCC